MTSVPAPPSSVSAIRAPALRSAVMKSTPPRPKTVRRSSAATRVLDPMTVGPEPSTRTVSRNGRTPMLLKPSVPWTWICVARAVEQAEVGVDAAAPPSRSRSPDVDQVLPAGGGRRRASRRRCCRSSTGRVSRAIRALPSLACSVNSSDSAVPTARSVSLPALAVERVEPVALERGVVARRRAGRCRRRRRAGPSRRRRRSRSSPRPGRRSRCRRPRRTRSSPARSARPRSGSCRRRRRSGSSICENVARLKAGAVDVDAWWARSGAA